MKKYIVMAIAAAFICTNSYAAEQKATAAQTPAAQPQKAVAATVAVPSANAPAASAAAKTAAPAAATSEKKPTRAETIARINEILTNRPNIVPMIQGLEMVKPETGAPYYTFNKKKIEELDDDTLLKLLSMINQQLSLQNLQQFERQQRQLKNLQQIEQINKTQRMLKQNTTTTTPKVYTPPKVPKTYK